MVDVTRGYTFAENEEVTAVKLHSLVDGSTFANMVLGDFSGDGKPIFKGGTAPSNPITGQLWLQTNFGSGGEPPGFIFAWNGSCWMPLGGGASLTNRSGFTVTKTDCVAIDTSNNLSFVRPGASGSTQVVGIAVETINDGSAGVIQTHGPSRVSAVSGSSPVHWGAIVTESNSFKIRADSRNASAGTFGRLLDTTNGYCYLTGLVGG